MCACFSETETASNTSKLNGKPTILLFHLFSTTYGTECKKKTWAVTRHISQSFEMGALKKRTDLFFSLIKLALETLFHAYRNR